MQIVRYPARHRSETRELRVDGALYRVHLVQSPWSGTRLWAERYIPPRSQWNGVYGGYAGMWLTVHDWR